MSHEHHQWRIGDEPPIIRAHSLAKHRVLQGYLEEYIFVQTCDPRMDQLRLTLVDGFAGGGMYRHHKTGELSFGSPLLMLRAMRNAELRAKEKRLKPFDLDVRYVFIEKNAEAREFLVRTIRESEFAPLLAGRITILEGEFLTHLEAISRDIKSRSKNGRSIFVLDQFGYKDAPLVAIRSILTNLRKSEVILTFAIDHLINYMGSGEATQKLMGRVGFKMSPEEISSDKEDLSWRRKIQTRLYGQLVLGSGAKYFTPFFIRSEDSHRDLWLVHLSGHHRARDVMVGHHWQQSTSFAHYAGAGLNMLGYDQDRDLAVTGQPMLFAFDEDAAKLTHELLCEQLPARLYDCTDGISFEQIFEKLTNETPATSRMLRCAISESVRRGDFFLKDASGSISRKRSVTKGSDIVVPNRQLRLFLP